MDPETAVKSRRELLHKADHWFGAHIPFPGKIRIKRGTHSETGNTQFTFESNSISSQTLRCPVCFQTDSIRRILYGKPGRDTMEAMKRGEIISGGCIKAPETHGCLFCLQELAPLLRKIGKSLQDAPDLHLKPEPAWREYSQGKIRIKIQCGWKCGDITLLIMPDAMRFKPNQGMIHLRIPLRKNSPLTLYITAPKEKIQSVHRALMQASPPIRDKEI